MTLSTVKILYACCTTTSQHSGKTRRHGCIYLGPKHVAHLVFKDMLLDLVVEQLLAEVEQMLVEGVGPGRRRGDVLGRGEQDRRGWTANVVEAELEGERIGLTLWDSTGLEKAIVDLQLREMASFIESKFEETFAEEQKVMRSPGFRDTHIHCVFLVLDPLKLDANIAVAQQSSDNISRSRVGGLDDDVDVQVLRALWEKTVVIPVIAKADTLTSQHMAYLKRAVWRSIKDNSMNPLDALELEDDDGGNLDEPDGLDY